MYCLISKDSILGSKWTKIENMPIDFFIRFLLSYTEFFLNNETVKLDFTLVFHMDVWALEIPTYAHTSLQWVILFAEFKLQKRHPNKHIMLVFLEEIF